MNYREPVLIICEATCADDSGICDPVLRLDIPSQPCVCNDDHNIIYLPEAEKSRQFLFSYVSRKNDSMTVTEFTIIPYSDDLHGAFATCELRNQYQSLDLTEYVLVFSRPFPIVACELKPTGEVVHVQTNGMQSSVSWLSIFFIVLWIVTLLATVPIIIASFLVRYRKKVTPIGEKSSFAVKLEDTTVDEVKEMETFTNQDAAHDDDSQMQNKIDHKLPDTISSRDD